MEKIIYGFHETPFGEIVLGKTDKGLCWLGFMTDREQGAYKGNGHARMVEFYPKAEFVRDDAAVAGLAQEIMQAWQEDCLTEIKLDLRGTDFQRAVWQHLLCIPKGKVETYGEVANDIGRPGAMRAVGTAVGSNPISWVVPCHRVVPASGGVGNYGWGPEIKKNLLAAELA